jgi:tRNA threonylcarbamoyladenosine biosynthesis protein TsaB
MLNRALILAPILAIDTCGPSGSAALGRLSRSGSGPELEMLGQIELEGRTYSATLVTAVRDLLQTAGLKLSDLGGIVAVSGPGSFTGVRVGLSAVKGLAETAHLPVVAVSRLQVLARKAGVFSAALDAHRGELFLRLEQAGCEPRELLAGSEEMAAIDSAPAHIAICEDAAAGILASAWPHAHQVRTSAPMAADALRLGAPLLSAGAAADLALLDGHYLRRSDAEIFAEPAAELQKP